MFFQFWQNNSYGRFNIDKVKGIGVVVIVEADSAVEANERAESIGLYFDGDGDCPCCGDRWTESWSDKDGDDVPSYYGKAICSEMNDLPLTFIHYKDGTITKMGKGE